MIKLGKYGYVLIVMVILFTSAWIYPVAVAALQVSKGGKILNEVVKAAGLESAASLCVSDVSDGQIDPEALDSAAIRFRQAADYHPDDAYSWYLLGKINCLIGDYDAAIDNFSTFIEARPANPLGYVDRSFAMESKCKEQGEDTFQIPPPLNAHQVCQDAFMVDLILDEWYLGDVLFSHMMSRGKSESEAGRIDHALEWYARAVMLDPETGAPWVQAGDIYYTNEDWAEAEQAFEIAEDRAMTRDVSYKLGYSRFQMEAYALAADSFENAAARTAGEIGLSNVYFFLGLSVDSLPHDEATIARAIDAYTNAIEIDDYTEQTWRQSDAYYRRGVLYLELKRTDEAMGEFEQTLAINPNHYWAHVLMARVFRIAGDNDSALEYAEKAIEIRPDSKGAYRFLGEYYLETGNPEEAREMYSSILSIDPNDKEALLVLESLTP